MNHNQWTVIAYWITKELVCELISRREFDSIFDFPKLFEDS